MPAEETATFALKIDAEQEPAKEAVESLERFRAAIEKSQVNVANYRKSMSLLKGSSDEVSDAKAKLKAAIEAEKQAITRDNLAILKLGGSFDKLQKAHKKANNEFVAGKKVVNAIGGPVKDVTEKIAGLKEILASTSGGFGLMAVAAVAAVAGLAVLAAGAVGLIAKFTQWLLVAGDMNRNLQLTREAFSGSAKDATAWGHQIDWTRIHVALTNEELNKLQNETEKTFRNTRISGQGMVDVWKAVALARGAGREDTAAKIQSILDRAKNLGRGGIAITAPGIDELQGTGLSRQKVAVQLAKDLHVSIGQANAALVRGLVTSDALARALKEASQVQFGALNESKLRSIDGLTASLKDNVSNWTQELAKADGPLAPLLNDLKSLVDLTSLQSESGQSAKRAVTEYASRFSAFVHKNLPTLKAMAVRAIDLVVAILRGAAAVEKFAESSSGLFLIKATLIAIALVVGAVVLAFAPLVIAAAAIAGAFEAVGAALTGIKTAYDWLKGLDWKSIGDAIVHGIGEGIRGAAGWLVDKIKGIARTIKNAFTGKDGIDAHSPSRLFYGYGRGGVGLGFARGIEASEPMIRGASAGMVGAASAPVTSGAVASAEDVGGAPSAAGEGAGPRVEISIKIENNVSGAEPAKLGAVLNSPSILDGVTHAIQTALRSAGIPTGSLSYSGG